MSHTILVVDDETRIVKLVREFGDYPIRLPAEYTEET